MRRLLAGVALAAAALGAHAQMNGGVMESQKQGTAAITAGAINGATVGATTPASGKFTTLQATGAFTGVTGALTKAAAGDVLTITNGGGTPVTGFLSSDAVQVGLFTGAGLTGQGIRLDSQSNIVRAFGTNGEIWRGNDVASAARYVNINNATAANNPGFTPSAGNLVVGGSVLPGATLLISSTAPTISSGFGTSPSVSANNGTAAFRVNVGTGGVATSGVIGLPTAATGWNCSCTDLTTNSATVFLCKQTASATTTATIGNFNTAGAAAAWVASDIVALSCFAL